MSPEEQANENMLRAFRLAESGHARVVGDMPPAELLRLVALDALETDPVAMTAALAELAGAQLLILCTVTKKSPQELFPMIRAAILQAGPS